MIGTSEVREIASVPVLTWIHIMKIVDNLSLGYYPVTTREQMRLVWLRRFLS